jgi:LPXTG-motif cell wall-anchored protein
MPSARRLLAISGAAFVGLAATALFAVPASAHAAKLTYDVECKDNGKAKVTWHIYNDHSTKAKLKTVTAAPEVPGIAVGTEIKSHKTVSGSVTVKSGDTATLSYIAVWPSDGYTYAPPVGATKADTGKCKPDCPPTIDIQGGHGHPSPKPSCRPTESGSPKPSSSASAKPSSSASAKPSTSASAQPSGSGSPTPTDTDTPPAPGSSTPALPVTGAQTAAYAGGSLLLLGAGAGLFFVARRRRIRFEA